MKSMHIITATLLTTLCLTIPAQGRDKIHESATRCTISGILSKQNTARKVYVAKPKGRGLIKLDSASVVDGKFTLQTNFDSIPVARFVLIGEGEQAFPVEVYLDGDELTLTQIGDEPKVRVSGSESNEAASRMADETSGLEEQISQTYKQYKDTTLTQDQRKEAGKRMEQIDDQISGIQIRYMKDNISNYFGLRLLSDLCYTLGGPSTETYLLQVPAVFKSTNDYKLLSKFVENDKKVTAGFDYIPFTLPDPNGKPVSLSSLINEGKYVIIDFWASWCGPCRREMPNMVKLYQDFKDHGIAIIGVSLDQDAKAWKQAIKDLHMTWPQVSDLKGWKSEIANKYGIQAIPQTVIVSPGGRFIAKGLRGEKLYEAAKQWASKE